jgi:hypothetical protein
LLRYWSPLCRGEAFLEAIAEAARPLLVGSTHSPPKGALALRLLGLAGLVAHEPRSAGPECRAGRSAGQPAGPSYHRCRSCRASPMNPRQQRSTLATRILLRLFAWDSHSSTSPVYRDGYHIHAFISIWCYLHQYNISDAWPRSRWLGTA